MISRVIHLAPSEKLWNGVLIKIALCYFSTWQTKLPWDMNLKRRQDERLRKNNSFTLLSYLNVFFLWEKFSLLKNIFIWPGHNSWQKIDWISSVADVKLTFTSAKFENFCNCTGLSMNILHAGNKSPAQRHFSTIAWAIYKWAFPKISGQALQFL